jgi:hypothetical protein
MVQWRVPPFVRNTCICTIADEQLGDVEISHYLKSHEVELCCACSGHSRPHHLFFGKKFGTVELSTVYSFVMRGRLVLVPDIHVRADLGQKSHNIEIFESEMLRAVVTVPGRRGYICLHHS